MGQNGESGSLKMEKKTVISTWRKGWGQSKFPSFGDMSMLEV